MRKFGMTLDDVIKLLESMKDEEIEIAVDIGEEYQYTDLEGDKYYKPFTNIYIEKKQWKEEKHD